MATFHTVRLQLHSMSFDDEGMPGWKVVDLTDKIKDFTLNLTDVDKTRFAPDED